MFRALSDDLLSLLLPGKCPGCGRRAEPVCAECAASMRAAPPGRPLPGVTWAVAAFAYEGVARELVARVKYRNERLAVRWLSARLAQCCARRAALRRRHVDPGERAPPRRARRRSRCAPRACRRRRARSSGAALAPPRQRSAANGSGGRGASGGADAARRRLGAGRAVLVVDDVVTTGATLAAAARVLRGSGARDVLAATVARTPGPGDRSRGRCLYSATSVVDRIAQCTADDLGGDDGHRRGRQAR